MKKSFSTILGLAIALVATAQTPDDLLDESTVVLTWRPPLQIPLADVKGFNLHWGPVSRQYTNSLFFGSSNTVMMLGPNVGIPITIGSKFYFGINMVRQDDSVSPFSNEIVVDTTPPADAASGSAEAPVLSTVSWLRQHPSTYTNEPAPDPDPEPEPEPEPVYETNYFCDLVYKANLNTNVLSYTTFASSTANRQASSLFRATTTSTNCSAIIVLTKQGEPLGDVVLSVWRKDGTTETLLGESLPVPFSVLTASTSQTNQVAFSFPSPFVVATGTINRLVLSTINASNLNSLNNLKWWRNNVYDDAGNGVWISAPDTATWALSTGYRRGLFQLVGLREEIHELPEP